ncbi:MAG: DUF3147 family protein [Pseudomonadota bacterium]
MTWIITKYLITAACVVFISEVAKRSDKIGGFIAALPIVTILAIIWMHIEGQGFTKISNHMWYTFWYVIPTLPMFIVFPHLLSRMNFWLSLGTGIFITIVSFGLFAALLRRWEIILL